MTTSKIIITCIAIISILLFIILLSILAKKGYLKKLKKFIEEAIKEAELKYPSGNGAEKKVIVMDIVRQTCSKLHIPYWIVKIPVSKLIDKIIEYYNILAK